VAGPPAPLMLRQKSRSGSASEKYQAVIRRLRASPTSQIGWRLVAAEARTAAGPGQSWWSSASSSRVGVRCPAATLKSEGEVFDVHDEIFASVLAGPDGKEGARAFIERRAPQWPSSW